MAESKVLNPPAADKKNPNRTGKVCEFLTYSGREAFKRLRTNVLISLGDKTEWTSWRTARHSPTATKP